MARSIDEPHRAASQRELLFDLTFVIAIASLSGRFAHVIGGGHGLEALVPFLQVFFAIWWAWVNFTWFASSFDTDDVPFRLLTLVQMAAGRADDGPEPDRQGGRVSEPEGLEGPFVGPPTWGSCQHPHRRAPGSAWARNWAGEERSAAGRAAWSGLPARTSPGWGQLPGLGLDA
jgi:hypothetical protein